MESITTGPRATLTITTIIIGLAFFFLLGQNGFQRVGLDFDLPDRTFALLEPIPPRILLTAPVAYKLPFAIGSYASLTAHIRGGGGVHLDWV